MSLYKTIVTQLKSSGIKTDIKTLETTPLIGYMVLEAAGLLNLAKDLEIQFQEQCDSAFEKSDAKERSTLILNLNASNEDNQLIAEFCELAKAIVDKYPQSERDTYSKATYELIMLDDDIRLAIQSSAFLTAAGDLSKLTLNDLLLLGKKLELYQSDNENFAKIINELNIKITKHLEKNNTADDIQKATLNVNKQLAAHAIMKVQERQFIESFAGLTQKTEEFLKKGSPFIRGDQFEFAQYIDGRPNPDYIPEYNAAAKAAVKLTDSLTTARLSFFNYNNLVTIDDLLKFEKSCKDAINEARTEFSKFRELPHAWLNDLDPIFKDILQAVKAIVGYFAYIFYPLIEKYSKRGFDGLFFETKPDAMFDLDNFETKVCDETTGIISELRPALS